MRDTISTMTTTSYRFTLDDEHRIAKRIRHTIGEWRDEGVNVKQHREELRRIAAHAIACSIDDLRDVEVDWIDQQITEQLEDDERRPPAMTKPKRLTPQQRKALGIIGMRESTTGEELAARLNTSTHGAHQTAASLVRLGRVERFATRPTRYRAVR